VKEKEGEREGEGERELKRGGRGEREKHLYSVSFRVRCCEQNIILTPLL